MDRTQSRALALGVFLGLGLLGYLLASAAIDVKEYERTVTVKGLSEREVAADVVIWPVAFTNAGNDVQQLYLTMDEHVEKIRAFLTLKGIAEDAISINPPLVTDKSAQQWGGGQKAEFRYTATQTVTVYSNEIEQVRHAMQSISELGKEGLVFGGNAYENQPDYQFSGLNGLKPEMVEEATRHARSVAQKFAHDSDSQLGKIRRASQGQFSISDRDRNTPYLKKVRVVSTIEYYLVD
ncbi:SIMPL domain-containing protein [Lacimicrobium sp. SS2-24]|uniref:SIMPL domain-containing protein n=1 Tax=Lacimicrobium sp. SS2-24 TaxID=2005569 RepID=UPI000B4B0650|nr:SIMPL domain-containing protein [Lacimicrobium sp. SS2-24]